MDKILDELYLILEALNKLFSQLKEISKAKQPILIKGDIAGLDELTKKEQLLVVQVGKLEERRFQLQQAIANHFSISVVDLTMNLLMEKVDEVNKKRLTKVFDALEQEVKEVKGINDSNTHLIQQSLDYIDYSINLVTSFEEKTTYPDNTKGSNTNKNHARIFDQKI
jgi:flagellar biosynthesis/type III secretory pathway chaperone